MNKSTMQKTHNTKTQKEREDFIKEFFGFNPKGIVDYISGKTPTGYHSASAICNNCGAKAKDTKQADEWQFGHPDCPKPNGLYVRNDVKAEDIVNYHLKALAQKEDEIMEKIEKMKSEKHPERYYIDDGKCMYCQNERGTEHKASCDFLIEAK